MYGLSFGAVAAGKGLSVGQALGAHLTIDETTAMATVRDDVRAARPSP